MPKKLTKSRKIQNATKLKISQKRHKNQNCQKFQRTPKIKNAKVLKRPEIKEVTIPAMSHELKKHPEKPKRP